MRRAVLLLLVFLSLVAAQDNQGSVRPLDRSPPPEVSPLQIVAPDPEFRLSSRVILVVDVSGSMQDGNKLSQAVQSCYLLLNNGSDDFRIGVITFAGEHLRWVGIQEPCQHEPLEACGKRCDRPGWTRIPDFMQETIDYLRAFKGSGTTTPGPALREAILDPTDPLTIVFISDGEFNQDESMACVQLAIDGRKALGLPAASIMVWGAGRSAKDQETLKSIAKLGGGGFWVHDDEKAGPF